MSEQQRLEEFVRLMTFCVQRRFWPMAVKKSPVQAFLRVRWLGSPDEVISPLVIQGWAERCRNEIHRSPLGIVGFLRLRFSNEEACACWLSHELRAQAFWRGNVAMN